MGNNNKLGTIQVINKKGERKIIASGFTIIASRPAMGKTALALTIALNEALNGIPVALFSLEMSKKQLLRRILSNLCDIPTERFINNALSDVEIEECMKRLENLPLYIDDAPGISDSELCAKARDLVHEYGVKAIIIDYMQLMSTERKHDSRELQLAAIVHSLKELSRELEIPVIAMSGLKRTEKSLNGDFYPDLSDLRESGIDEQYADAVCFIYRPEYYDIDTENENGKGIKGYTEFIIAKCPEGRTQTIEMIFRPEYVRFEWP